MKEILGRKIEKAFEELGIKAVNTYKSDQYEVWQLSDKDFKTICDIPDADWKDSWGWWRSSEGSNMTADTAIFKIKGQPITAWIDEESKELAEEDGEEYIPEEAEYSSLTEYFSEAIGAGQPRNVCALAVHLAKLNNVTMGELFSKYN